jgi:hypothetical protein
MRKIALTFANASSLRPLIATRASLTLSLVLLGAVSGPAQARDKFPRVVAEAVVQLAELPKQVVPESSGLVVSRQFPGVLWTHNDGKDRRLFAINRAGEMLAEFEVRGVFIWDWEDLALDDANRLYVADTGNNALIRPTLSVHRVHEPDPAQSGAGLTVERSWVLRFPGKGFDAEALVIWQDHGYLIEKPGSRKKAGLYRWSLTEGPMVTLERLGQLEVKSRVTGADLSPDGNRLALVSVDGAWLIECVGGPAQASKQKPFHVPFKLGQIEGCAFDHDGLLASSEQRELFLFQAAPFVLSRDE